MKPKLAVTKIDQPRVHDSSLGPDIDLSI